MRYVSLGFGNYREQPNFDNMNACGSNNPYSQAKLYDQCPWFAWGRFYEIYGYSPGFTGDGWDCAEQLVNAHPDKFKLSDTPAVGAVFSCIGRNHTGIVISWDGKNVTIQEGNLDNKTIHLKMQKKTGKLYRIHLNNSKLCVMETNLQILNKSMINNYFHLSYRVIENAL